MSRRQAINELAYNLHDILDLKVPVAIERVPESLGGAIKYVDSLEEGMEAKIEKMPSGHEKKFIITLQRETCEQRRRFSIAHELGHLFIHMKYLIDQQEWEKNEEYKDSVYYRYGHGMEENEANEFAGAFLMPKDKFLEVAQENFKQGKYHLDPIAKYFDVSVSAVRVRGRWLNLFSWED
ncbi:ImmA/IrrE family metallo-endopeptidase [Bacillus cereus]